MMVLGVLERRTEIGLRRALGATRRHVAGQFFSEATLISLIGGIAGIAGGSLATATYATLELVFQEAGGAPPRGQGG